MASHNNGIRWKEVAAVVAKYAKLNFNAVETPFRRKTRPCVASVSSFSNVAKLIPGSPKSRKPISSPEFLSNTKLELIFISSNKRTTYLCRSRYEFVCNFNLCGPFS